MSLIQIFRVFCHTFARTRAGCAVTKHTLHNNQNNTETYFVKNNLVKHNKQLASQRAF